MVSPELRGMTSAPASTVVFEVSAHAAAPGLTLVCVRRMRAVGTDALAGARCRRTVRLAGSKSTEAEVTGIERDPQAKRCEEEAVAERVERGERGLVP